MAAAGGREGISDERRGQRKCCTSWTYICFGERPHCRFGNGVKPCRRERGHKICPFWRKSACTSLSRAVLRTHGARCGGRLETHSPRVVALFSAAPRPIWRRRRLQPNYPPRTPSPPGVEDCLLLLLRRHEGGGGGADTTEGIVNDVRGKLFNTTNKRDAAVLWFRLHNTSSGILVVAKERRRVSLPAPLYTFFRHQAGRLVHACPAVPCAIPTAINASLLAPVNYGISPRSLIPFNGAASAIPCRLALAAPIIFLRFR